MASRPFQQVDVFTTTPTSRYTGNPLAVVQDCQGLSKEQMQKFAAWTNLSETAFLLPPSVPEADYQVRIFTPHAELPFAGHPTLGSAHAWLAYKRLLEGTRPEQQEKEVVQQCGAGLVRLRKAEGRLSLAAPPLLEDREVEPSVAAGGLQACGCSETDVVASRYLCNGPAFHVFLLPSAEAVLKLRPNFGALRGLASGTGWGFIGPYIDSKPGGPDFECRMFFPDTGVDEDPITGSFKYVFGSRACVEERRIRGNLSDADPVFSFFLPSHIAPVCADEWVSAAVAQWLIGAEKAPKAYLVSQGTILGRQGRVHVYSAAQDIWIGGETVTCIEGTVVI